MSIARIIGFILQAYVIVLIAAALLSWVRPAYDSPIRKIQQVLAAITEPVLAPMRRILPTPRAPRSASSRGQTPGSANGSWRLDTMHGMDASQSALDSLRTVEFRETLKGYHRDDVDEYLEKAAVEAEGLQEQFRQANERLRQAGERIAQLEAALERQTEPQAPAAPEAPVIADETLQRTLVLAQQFVDQTRAASEARA